MNLQMTLFEDQPKQIKKQTNRLDLVGQKFGHLSVLRFNEVRGNYTYWDCKCDCGNLKTVKGTDLKNNTITSCGCIRKKYASKTETWETRAIGEKFNQLTVIEYIGKNKGGKFLFKCLCDCGQITTADISALQSGGKKSCGCGLQKFRESGTTKLDMAGKEFGYLTAIEPSGKSRAGDIIWRCKCVCGNEVFKKASSLKFHATTLHCGC